MESIGDERWIGAADCLIAELSTALCEVGENDLDPVIEPMLKRIGQAVDVDRATVVVAGPYRA